MKRYISVTTTGNRAGFALYSIQSLVSQNLKPDEIIVNVAKDDFVDKTEESEALLSWLSKSQIAVNWVENTGPYKKLLPTLTEVGEDDLIVTADDDILYSRSWFKGLIELHNQNSSSIVCTKARVIRKNIFHRWMNYSEWTKIEKKRAGLNLIPIGMGGVVYKKGLLNTDFMFDENSKKLSPRADDLWFKMGALLNKTNTVVDPNPFLGSYDIEHDFGLCNTNKVSSSNRNLFLKTSTYVGMHLIGKTGIPIAQNDIYWRNILDYVKKEYSFKENF